VGNKDNFQRPKVQGTNASSPSSSAKLDGHLRKVPSELGGCLTIKTGAKSSIALSGAQYGLEDKKQGTDVWSNSLKKLFLSACVIRWLGGLGAELQVDVA
jgi:hypothetical protein